MTEEEPTAAPEEIAKPSARPPTKPKREKPFKEKPPRIERAEPIAKGEVMASEPRARPLPKRRRPTISPETTLQSVNKDIMQMFTATIHMLEETLRAGKLNPSQGLLGMVMVADLLHGGAYTVPNNQRPALVGKSSPYYGGDQIGPVDFQPVAGFNIFDIFTSIGNVFEAAAETNYGRGVAAEVYLNANVPHKFPKLLSDEAYAKILVMSLYLVHTDLFTKNALGVKTFVEGEATLITAEAGAVEKLGATAKKLMPLLSLTEGAE